MSLPQPISDIETRAPVRSSGTSRYSRRRSLRPKAARWRPLGWEMTGRLSVNLVLSLIALAALAKLVPHYQAQQQALHQVEQSVKAAQQRNQQLRASFSRHFDSSQTYQLIQQEGLFASEEYLPVVLVDALGSPAPIEE